MAGRKDIVAQVRLLFHNTNGVRMVCSRSMQLSIARNGARKQTTLDGQLLLGTATGERTAISSRCAELDVQMPLSLGVSKAVLENVIFCHQEDSFWPLSEPGPLKKKFDDIFENARYTRALMELKELKKVQDREVKSDEQALEFMKADKERADKVPMSSYHNLTIPRARKPIYLPPLRSFSVFSFYIYIFLLNAH
jgi:DNA repair protein RAD50